MRWQTTHWFTHEEISVAAEWRSCLACCVACTHFAIRSHVLLLQPHLLVAGSAFCSYCCSYCCCFCFFSVAVVCANMSDFAFFSFFIILSPSHFSGCVPLANKRPHHRPHATTNNITHQFASVRISVNDAFKSVWWAAISPLIYLNCVRNFVDVACRTDTRTHSNVCVYVCVFDCALHFVSFKDELRLTA